MSTALGFADQMGPMIRRWLAAVGLLIAACLTATIAVAAPNYPERTSRVNDYAGVLSADVRTRLIDKLAEIETAQGHQLVVAIVNSLDGSDVETYAHDLFRRWQLGRKDKNDGVLLLVSKGDRKIRIEVGYGLEGTLTDAVSKGIITNRIAPKLKAGDWSGGIEAGADSILAILKDPKAAEEFGKKSGPGAAQHQSTGDTLAGLGVLGFVGLFLYGLFTNVRREFRSFFANRRINTVPQTGRWGRKFRRDSGTGGFGPGAVTGASWGSGWGNGGSSSGGGWSNDSSSGGGGDSGGGGASGDF